MKKLETKIDSIWLIWLSLTKKLARRQITSPVPFVPWLYINPLSVRVATLSSALSALIHGLPRTSIAQRNVKEMKLSTLDLCIGSLSRSWRHSSLNAKQPNAQVLPSMVMPLSIFIHANNRCKPAHKVAEWDYMLKTSSIISRFNVQRPSTSVRNVTKTFSPTTLKNTTASPPLKSSLPLQEKKTKLFALKTHKTQVAQDPTMVMEEEAA